MKTTKGRDNMSKFPLQPIKEINGTTSIKCLTLNIYTTEMF